MGAPWAVDPDQKGQSSFLELLVKVHEQDIDSADENPGHR
jgi:hypothetical protein